jgi:hypothetical protein
LETAKERVSEFEEFNGTIQMQPCKEKRLKKNKPNPQ